MADITIEHTGEASGTARRPQPIGVFPLPAGYLLVPDGPGHDEVRAALVDGKLPTDLPESLEFYRHALDGDLDAALVSLVGDDLITRVNRFVLDPSADALDLLLADVAALDGDSVVDLRAFVETIAFVACAARTSAANSSLAPPTAGGTARRPTTKAIVSTNARRSTTESPSSAATSASRRPQFSLMDTIKMADQLENKAEKFSKFMVGASTSDLTHQLIKGYFQHLKRRKNLLKVHKM